MLLFCQDQLQKMLSINERLGNMVNVIDPGRKFIKEGMLKRISPKDGSKTDRYLFLVLLINSTDILTQ